MGINERGEREKGEEMTRESDEKQSGLHRCGCICAPLISMFGQEMNRRTKIIIGTCLFGWLLTLGIFHDRSVSWRFTIKGAEAWGQFESGKLRVYPSTWVNSAHSKSRGIPYLLYSTVDRPPYALSFCFTAIESDRAKALVLHDIAIRYEDGSTEQIKIPTNGAREQFYLDERGKDRGEAVYRRVNFAFSDALAKRQSCTINLRGAFESEEGSEPYSEEIDLQLEDKTHFYIGWIALLLRRIQ